MLSFIPFVSFGCCLWLLGGGAVAVFLYQRRVPGALVTPGMGMRIGALAGAFAFILNAVWSTLMFATAGDQVRKSMEEQMQASMAKSTDPQVQQMVQQFLARLNTPEGIATFFVSILLIIGIVFVLFCAAGGALGASISARRQNIR